MSMLINNINGLRKDLRIILIEGKDISDEPYMVDLHEAYNSLGKALEKLEGAR